MSTQSSGSPLTPLSPASITSPQHQQHYVPASGFMPLASSASPMTGVVQAQLPTNQAPLTSPRQPTSAMMNNNPSFAMPTPAAAAGDSKRVVRPRKSHIKSRKGCGNCKRRRIKCDEEHPQCFNCLKHGVDCDYLGQAQHNGKPAPVVKPIKNEFAPVDAISPSSSVSSPDVASYGMPMTPGTVSVSILTSSSVGTAHNIIPAPSLSPSLPSPTLRAATPQPAPAATSILPGSESEFATLHMAQLELLHHFLTVTSPTLSDVTDGDLWLTQIPRMAFRHDFLMYAILTIAATHMRFLQDKGKAASAASSFQLDQDDLACTQQRELYFARAEIWYRQRSLETFRAAISGERTAGNLEAMTIAGSLIAIQSFAYHEKGHEAADDPADSSANDTDPQTATIISIDRWLPILLGIRAVVHEMRNMQTGIDLQSIFGIDFSCLASAAESDAPPPLAKLLELCSAMFAEQQTELEIYMAGIHLLSQLIAAFRHARPAELRKYVFTWPFLLSDEFHARLRLRDPVTLIVFVHFLAIVSLLNAWWQEERVRVDTKEICKLYLQDPKWRPWLEWVIEVLPFNLFE
ncbi:hypothetical protein V1520DRAFT_347203 [Lipomyces starkeyi]|uniref:Zn(2)-C6 fungal-type domain-containing protein n=1 Tax=Lipomyces starkeyi NRRL Y-11557 TaxID=675824 RepID=A0A1E3PYT7_LIPST|nr:hypothetical protein LIPSTDRAFT_6021 [Lipomyces starkeyi NRRL Y-11557]